MQKDFARRRIMEALRKKLKTLANKDYAAISQRFFKTGPGEYGEGDLFIGIRVPVLRKLAREHQDLAMKDVRQLLKSAVHEERLLALLILVLKYRRGGQAGQSRIYKLYLGSTRHINNWDLVDVTAEHIVGAYVNERSRQPLYNLCKSKGLWERRIAIISTFHFIRRGDYKDTLKIAGLLINDCEDLIHKAVGWMLREVGKRHLKTEEDFLKVRYRTMPRTMLRYAIERFPEAKRQRYLKGTVS
jgi:3-methyladenine DNA glycosylase AlkD